MNKHLIWETMQQLRRASMKLDLITWKMLSKGYKTRLYTNKPKTKLIRINIIYNNKTSFNYKNKLIIWNQLLLILRIKYEY